LYKRFEMVKNDEKCPRDKINPTAI